jgi:hypothetical protein
VQEHIIKRNVEQFSHAGETPLGYTKLGHELDHTGDTHMAEAILEGTFVRDSLSNYALAAIVKQLRNHPAVTEIIQPIVTEAGFNLAFKCVPEKTASSFFGPGAGGGGVNNTRHVQKAQKMEYRTFSRKFTLQ